MKEINSLQDKPLNKQPSNLEAEQALKHLSDDLMPKGSTFEFTKLYGYRSLGKGATSDVIGKGKFAFKVIYMKNKYDIQDPIVFERIF